MRTRARSHSIRVLAAALGLTALASAPLRADLITNRSFELGPAPGEAMSLGVGSTAIPGWVVTRNAIEYVGSRWSAAQGARSIALNGTAPGGIAQTFATVSGTEYTVHFFLAGDAFTNVKHLRTTAAGHSQDYEFDATHTWEWGMGWLEKTFAFTASGSSTTLEFYSLDAGAVGPAIDSVYIDAPVLDVPSVTAAGFALEAPFPNPTRAACGVSFAVPHETGVRLSVHDLQGREIALLGEGTYAPGRHRHLWGGETYSGKARPGLYWIRMTTPGATQTRKVVFAPY